MVFDLRRQEGGRSTKTGEGIVRNLIISTFLAINLMGINLGYNDEVAQGGLPVAVGWFSFGITLIILGLLGRPLAIDAFKALKRRTVSLELFFIVGITSAMGLSFINLFLRAGPIYFETAGILVVVYTLGKWIGARTRFQAIEETKRIVAGFLPGYQKILPDGSSTRIRSEQIRPGDLILVAAGTIIPVDAEIERGRSHAGEMLFTGEPLPKIVQAGDRVFAGTKAYDGDLTLRVLATGASTRLSYVFESVEAAMRLPSRWMKESDRLVSWFLPLILLFTAGTAAYWTISAGVELALMNALAVLLIACPCAMGLATPIVLWAGMGALAKIGVTIQNPDAIEKICDANYVVFDKTGTLTAATLDESDVIVLPGVDRTRTLGMIALLESMTDHPYAAVFARYRRPVEMARIVSITHLAGVGISGALSEAELYTELAIGNGGILTSDEERRLAKRLLDQTSSAPRDMGRAQIRVLYLKEHDRLIGAAVIRETTIQDPQALFSVLGIPVEILTGDPHSGARELFLKDGAAHPVFRFGLSPQEKAERIIQLQEQGFQVLFVGDGINDAPAMASSHASVALASPYSIPGRAAALTMSGNSLQSLVKLIACSKEIRQSLRKNLVWAAGYNIFGVLVAAAGLLEPVFAATLMTGSSLFVSWRAHLLRERLLKVLSSENQPA